MKCGYNEELSNCYYDGVLSKVLSVKKIGEYTIYKTPFEYVVVSGEYSAHSKTIKKGIEDISFKKVAEKLKKEPILENTIITKQYYRIVTGACELGVEQFCKQNRLESFDSITAKELLPILQKNNAYGFERFKELCSF